MSKRKQVVGVVLILGLVLLMACTPKVAPAPQAPAPALAQQAPSSAAAAAPAKPAWEEEWDRTVAAAKKEGTLVVLATSGPEVNRPVSDAFRSRTGINIEWLVGVGAELGVRTVSERRAGIYSRDAAIIGFSVPFAQLKPAGASAPLDKVLLLPELTDPQEIQKVWRFKKLEWVDKDRTMLTFALRVEYTAFVINTNLVKSGEIKGYRDLLNPKWKGKIIMYDVTMGTGPGSSWVQPVGTHIMGWDYMRKLAEQEPVLTRDARLQMEWLAHGKYAISLAGRSEMLKAFADIGAPVKGLLPEEGSYATPGPSVVSLIKDAPHPNAAKLFVNWLLSKEGQAVWVTTPLITPSLRLDVSVAGLEPAAIPDPKLLYIRPDTEEALLARADALKMAQEIFGAKK